MKPLTKKLWRDLWHLRGQVIAIVLVLGSGLATLLMSLGTLHSLEQTLDRIYAESRFADVWLSLVRAPEGRAAAIADWARAASSLSARSAFSARASCSAAPRERPIPQPIATPSISAMAAKPIQSVAFTCLSLSF